MDELREYLACSVLARGAAVFAISRSGYRVFDGSAVEGLRLIRSPTELHIDLLVVVVATVAVLDEVDGRGPEVGGDSVVAERVVDEGGAVEPSCTSGYSLS